MTWLYQPLPAAGAAGPVVLTLAVEAASATATGQPVDLTHIVYADEVEATAEGQALALSLRMPIAAADATATGSTVGLSETLRLVIDAASATATGSDIDLTLSEEPAPAVAEQPSGGWEYEFRREQARYKRQAWTRKQERELAQLLRAKLRAEDDRKKVEEALSVESEADSELDRLRELVSTYAATADRDLWSNRTVRAVDYAQRAQTELAYQLALREIAKQVEEEELVILMALAAVA